MYKRIEKCRICGNLKLRTVLNLGSQSLTGVFPPPNTEVATVPLELVKCDGETCCGLVQLLHSCESTEMYGMNYGYRSGLNNSMVSHLQSITDYIYNTVKLESDDVVVDIGSNDGTLLKQYNRYNVKLNRFGIDPTAKKFLNYYDKDIKVVQDFFSKSNFESVCSKKAKVITSIAMFYDLEDPVAFATEIEKCLQDDGIWVFEQSYMPFMIQTNSFDTICQEHLEYYTLKQILWITNEAGLKIIDVDFNNTNGGSFRVTAARKNSHYIPNDKVSLASVAEDIGGYNNFEVFDLFSVNIEKCKESVMSFLTTCKRDNKRVLGYGASTKGNVLLQYFGITSNEIQAIAEVNEDKFGCVTPGSNIPIISEAEAREMKPDYFFVLPWHFKNTILEKESDYIKASGCKFVFPMPFFEIRG